MQTISQKEVLDAAAACERAAKAETIQEERRAVFDVIAHQHTIQAALMKQQMQRMNSLTMTGRQEERLPFRIEGEDWAYLESRVPADIWWHLYKQKNYGWKGLTSDEGQREMKKAYPIFFPKTVSGKVSVGWTGNGETKQRVKVRFAPGTLKLAE